MASSKGKSGRLLDLLGRLGQPMALPAPAPRPHTQGGLQNGGKR
ncbi:hypothetical protein [Thermostaphylospora chromogena]|uniref:Uncharacterized protein n=1 Tax=Thermostaphylospora chromogena TaxID=35622 RepID=A0A1H1DQG0_9ACTN|nr:hypothetical protein [Thermostaphylospora chromogena]SDQ78724.1 hypothetical protein SAMN04489764_2118 [Thermostaphylospora chromogena]